ncbi:radial spoke head protein 3 homolog [Gadus chalcogrammus]|uniref:radial spoke head protein 3 homolog n=1 Tax=Gadus chalcogrammus TaxID=1042646 RepID=UPI0024C4C8EC|nr:radial spoke head protein 3 homolog [Gadus chalcogrammus]
MSSVLPTQKESLNGTYTFSSRPRPAQNRSKYRENPAETNERHTNYGNIMYDRRVVRGNTYAQQIIPIPAPADRAEIEQREAHKRAMARKRARAQLRSKTPDAIPGRSHVDVQTELYLEELSDHIEATNVDCQTDAFLDKPPTPLFVPAKTGKDVATQIKDGELFDFDVEVRPVLEVLVGKTMEQSLLEVMEEEEMASLRAQQRSFQELRDAELAEVQRLEEQERRRREEKGRRIAQQREVLEKERETAEKVAAWAFTQHYLADLLASVYTALGDHGYFYDPVEKDIETSFFPWLMDEVSHNLEKSYVARDLLDTLILEVTQKRVDGFQELDS